MSVTRTRAGARRIELLVPTSDLSAIEFRPVAVLDTNRWDQGRIGGPQDLLCYLAGITMASWERVTYPDADRVLTEFFQHLPPRISQQISEGQLPVPMEVPDTFEPGPDDPFDPYYNPTGREPVPDPMTHRDPITGEIKPIGQSEYVGPGELGEPPPDDPPAPASARRTLPGGAFRRPDHLRVTPEVEGGFDPMPKGVQTQSLTAEERAQSTLFRPPELEKAPGQQDAPGRGMGIDLGERN